MSDLALYRKYRPNKFKEVTGQEHIVEALEGALKSGSTAHAYLFAGPRGTGKTSVARILARELGCTAHDLYEIDAASNRGIDEIRELRDGVRSLPFASPVKVYIIDEVHMMTTPAFNALLKTLEEPPEHVVFILATTDPAKLPDTIVSRCQTFTFRKPTLKQLGDTVARIAKAEGRKIDDDAAALIAALGGGSFRDTIGLLQQAMSAGSGAAVAAAAVEAVSGAPSQWLVFNFILSVLNSDAAGGLTVVRQAVEANRDMKVFIRLILRLVRAALLAKFAPALEASVLAELGEDEKKFVADISRRPEAVKLPNLLRELLAADREVGLAALPEIPLELALIKLVGQDKEV